MGKILFILQKKYYNPKHITYIKILKKLGYEIHIITDINNKIGYCDNQQTTTFNILKIKKYKNIENNYDMIYCNSKIQNIIIKLIMRKEKGKIIYINSKDNYKQTNENNEQKLNLKGFEYVFCSIGKFDSFHNQIMQLESMIRIIKKYPHVKLLIIGNGKLKEYYEHIIYKYELSQNVEILEQSLNDINIIKKCDCILSTNKGASFTTDSIIAITLNKPIIASNVIMNRCILKKENLFENSEDLKEKMKKYIETNKKYEEYYQIDEMKIKEILDEIKNI